MTEEKYSQPDFVLVKHVGDESILLNTESEVYFGLNRVGTYFYEKICMGQSMDSVVKEISGQFKIEPGIIETDCRGILQELLQIGLLQRG